MKIFKFINNIIIRSALMLIGLISIWGALLYYLFDLTNFFCILSVILAIISFFIIHLFLKPFKDSVNNYTKVKLSKSTIIFVVIFLILYGSLLFVLFISQTSEAIVSPWEVLPTYFFALFGALTAVLLWLAVKNPTFSWFLMPLYYFLFFSIATMVYKINYGFDPFIHQATESLIDKIGNVQPKPFYYLGQYSLVVILSKLFTDAVFYIDKLLVPVMAAIFMPWALLNFLNKLFTDKKNLAILALAVLIFPVSYFTITTPQNLAYLFLIIELLIGFVCVSYFDLIFIYILALAALSVHPIAGIPACLLAIILTIYHSDKTKIKKIAYSGVYFAMAFSLPIIFWFIGQRSECLGTDVSVVSDQIRGLFVPFEENFILNFLYLYGFNVKYILVAFFVGGLVIAIRHREIRDKTYLYLFSSIALLASHYTVKFIPFNFLINYERTYYADRMLLMVAFFLIPFATMFFYWLVQQILNENRFIKISFSFLLVTILISSLYFSYPRFDHYFNSRGYSTSLSDIKAVNWVKNNASEDFIVLADQQVSAASLKEYGFYKYYKNDIFYYSIPTGGILYKYYLNMVYEKPTKETIGQAMNQAGVNEGYFILNNYWWGFDKILEEAKLEADDWQEIDNGKVYVLKYKKK